MADVQDAPVGGSAEVPLLAADRTVDVVIATPKDGGLPPPATECFRLGRCERGWLQQLIAFTGPGWLMSIAYVDPGNLEADLQCGAQFGYALLWALLWSTVLGLGFQLLAARLGVCTRKNLAELCREHYPFHCRIGLWIVTEMAVIGSDIQEVIGCSIGLQLLFGTPLYIGVLITTFAAFGFLFLERFGIRWLEAFFGVLIAILSISMSRIFVEVGPDNAAVIEGLVVPTLPPNAVMQVVGMVGCIIMPHNLYLHSALVQSREIETGGEEQAMSLFTIESSLALFTTLLINLSVIAIFAKGFYGSEDSDQLGLANAGVYLGNSFGSAIRMIWAMGLVASGQSSTMTGAYAGQFAMQGFLNLKIASWKRAVITRCFALVPCLFVACMFGGGHSGLDALNGYLNILQSFVLPFAVVPLLTFCGSAGLMGRLVVSQGAKAVAWISALLIVLANVFLFVGQASESGSDRTASICVGAGITVYAVAVVYVAYAPHSSGTLSQDAEIIQARYQNQVVGPHENVATAAAKLIPC